MAKIPSIALIPSGYKATKIYSVLPVDGSADLTFDRGTSDDQTRVNSNGLIEDVAVDVPRLDYSDGGCPALLLEPATTNLITYSEEFDNAAWSSIGGASVSPDTAISPKGDLTADKVVSASSTSVQGVQDNPTFVSGSDYAISVFAKKSEYDWFRLNTGSFNGVFTNASAWFNISDGTIGTIESGITAKIEDYGNGWYRCSIVASASASAVGRVNFLLANQDNDNNVVGDGTSGTYFFGAQVEQQSYATSYVPSLGTSGVRAAESASKTGLSSYINSTEGVLYAEISALADSGGNRMIVLSDGPAADCVVLYYTGVSNQIRFIYSVASALSCSLTYTIPSVLDYHKVALKYKEDDFALYVDGLLVDTDTSGSVLTSGTLTELSFKRADGFPFYGKTKNLRVYNEALSDLELATLTGFTSFAEMRDYLNYTAE